MLLITLRAASCELRVVGLLLLLAGGGLGGHEAATTPALTAEPHSAVAALTPPAPPRPGAAVLGYSGDGKLVSVRKGSGDMTCLAPNRSVQRFHVACYHNSLEPFMARGRALRASGVNGDAVDSARFREIMAGRLNRSENHG